MNTETSQAFAAGVAVKAAAMVAERREQRLAQLTRLIDELSGEMGSSDFVDAMRERGYDIDACNATIKRRQANTN